MVTDGSFDVVIFRASGITANLKELIASVREISGKNGMLAGVMDYGRVGSSALVVSSAVLHALRAFSRERNLGRSFDSEVMRYAAGERQISVAIEKTGISPSTEEFVFFAAAEKLGTNEIEALMDVARHAGLGSIEMLPVNRESGILSESERELMERMALLEVSS